MPRTDDPPPRRAASNEQTGARVRAIAARGMKKPETLTSEEIKAVCASALNQSPSRKKFLGLF